MHKVTKKFLSLLLIALLLYGPTSQSVWAAEALQGPKVIPETETTVPPAPVTDGELHGLILMTQNQNRIAENMNTVVKIYTINPITGIQTQISEFKKLYPAMDLCTITTGVRGYFNYDYTKMATNIMNPDYNSYRNVSGFNHAGWIDQNGNFFDVSEYLKLEWPSRSIGFCGQEDVFVFSTGYKKPKEDGKLHLEAGIFYGTEAEIKQGKCHFFSDDTDIRTLTCSYTFSKDILGRVLLSTRANGEFRYGELPPTDYAEPSKNMFLADYLAPPYFPQSHVFPIKHYTSIIYDTISGQMIHYLPDSYNTDNKSEWGGVLSPDGTTVAYLTVPGTSGQVSLEYTDISGFFASGFNPASRGIPTKMELADGPVKQATWNVYDYVTENPSCILLEWRE